MSTADPAGPGPERSAHPGRTDRSDPHDRPAKDWAPLVGALLLLLAVAIFVLQNGAKVNIEFLFIEARLPLGVGLLLAAVLGGLISLLLGFLRRTRHRLHRR